MIHGEQIKAISCTSNFDPSAQKMLVPLQDFQSPFSTVRNAQHWIKAIIQKNAGQFMTGRAMHETLCSRSSNHRSHHEADFPLTEEATE